jgi:hypothetical protein
MKFYGEIKNGRCIFTVESDELDVTVRKGDAGNSQRESFMQCVDTIDSMLWRDEETEEAMATITLTVDDLQWLGKGKVQS